MMIRTTTFLTTNLINMTKNLTRMFLLLLFVCGEENNKLVLLRKMIEIGDGDDDLGGEGDDRDDVGLDDHDDDLGGDDGDDVGDLSVPIGWSQPRLPCSGCERCSSSLLNRQNAQTITLHPNLIHMGNVQHLFSNIYKH